MSVAQKVNRGCFGNCESFRPVKYFSYSPASASDCAATLNQFQGQSRSSSGNVRIFRFVNWRTAWATVVQFVAIAVADQSRTLAARCTEKMLPPETETLESATERIPNSARRVAAPRWNSAARYPPPDRHSA